MKPESSSSVSKAQSYTASMATPFTSQFCYKEKAEMLFEKLNCLNEKHEDEKHLKHQKTFQEIIKLQQLLGKNINQKKQAYNKVLEQIAAIQHQIEDQKIQANRDLLILQGCINDSSRECSRMFQKMTKERLQSQNNLIKFIDDKLQILFHKNSLLNNYSVHQESPVSPVQFVNDIKLLKEKTLGFYRKAQEEETKMVAEFNQALNSLKEQLKSEISRKENMQQPQINYMRQLHLQVNTKINTMRLNRQKLQSAVLQMLEKLVSNSAAQKPR